MIVAVDCGLGTVAPGPLALTLAISVAISVAVSVSFLVFFPFAASVPIAIPIPISVPFSVPFPVPFALAVSVATARVSRVSISLPILYAPARAIFTGSAIGLFGNRRQTVISARLALAIRTCAAATATAASTMGPT
jgi:hypothetical protein